MRMISVRRAPDKEPNDERSSVLDMLEDSEEREEMFFQNGSQKGWDIRPETYRNYLD